MECDKNRLRVWIFGRLRPRTAKFVASGILDEEEIRTEAAKQESAFKRSEQSSSFESSFRLLHDSFADNPNEVAHSIIKGFEQNIDILAVGQLSEVVQILDRLGDQKLSDHVIKYAEKNAPSSFWSEDDPFNRGVNDDRIKAIVELRRAEAKPAFNFERDLIAAAQTYKNETIAILAEQPPEEYLRLLDSKTGDDLRKVILSALEFRKISNASPEMRRVIEKTEQALRIIAKRSPLNALRIQKYGVSLDPLPGD